MNPSGTVAAGVLKCWWRGGLCVVLAAMPLLAAPVSAQEAWRKVLLMQLMSEKQCELEAVIGLRQFELAGDTVIDGRAQCNDGRHFDFERRKRFELPSHV